MVNVRQGRLGSAQWSDVYGSLNFGPTTEQMASPTSLAANVGSAQSAAVNAMSPAEPSGMIAHSFLTSPAGVLVLVAGALLVLSLSD